MTRILGAAALVVALAGAGCGEAHPRPRLRVAAASDLNAALDDVIARFTAAERVDVAVSYGSSGVLYKQLLNHAPFDMFLSADLSYPRQLAERSLTLANSEFRYAVGRLVVWVPASSPLDVESLGLRALAAPQVAHVAIANPQHAPYGAAAVAALRSAGLYDRVQPKLVFGENVAQAMQFAHTNAADAAIVALSLALAPQARDKGRWFDVPLTMYPRIEQGGTILKWAADADAARRFRAALLGADGRAVLRRYGFFLPEG